MIEYADHAAFIWLSAEALKYYPPQGLSKEHCVRRPFQEEYLRDIPQVVRASRGNGSFPPPGPPSGPPPPPPGLGPESPSHSASGSTSCSLPSRSPSAPSSEPGPLRPPPPPHGYLMDPKGAGIQDLKSNETTATTKPKIFAETLRPAQSEYTNYGAFHSKVEPADEKTAAEKTGEIVPVAGDVVTSSGHGPS